MAQYLLFILLTRHTLSRPIRFQYECLQVRPRFALGTEISLNLEVHLTTFGRVWSK
jgi:hypothetical protein